MATGLHAYNYHNLDALTFIFTTTEGDEYKCYFLSYADYFANQPKLASKFFSFNLEIVQKPPKHKGVDKRIADTVITIVGNFLESQINAVVYVCDNSDNKEALRARKFKTWFSYYDHPSHQILQVNGDFEAGGIRLYTTLLIHKKNKLKKELIEAYLELTDPDEEK